MSHSSAQVKICIDGCRSVFLIRLASDGFHVSCLCIQSLLSGDYLFFSPRHYDGLSLVGFEPPSILSQSSSTYLKTRNCSSLLLHTDISILYYCLKIAKDSLTVAAWVAFLIALNALYVTLAQAVQQYIATAQSIRKGDKLVWCPTQVVAADRSRHGTSCDFAWSSRCPISSFPESWEVPGPARLFPTERIIALCHSFAKETSNGYDEEVAERGARKLVGYLSRDKLAMFVQMRFNFGLTTSDADRWPADLPVVPMQVSLRDIAVLGLMTSMSIL
jgi:hypothetical protein